MQWRGLDSSGSRCEQEASRCEHNNGPSGSIKFGVFLGQVMNYQLLKKDIAPWSLLVSLGTTLCKNSAESRAVHGKFSDLKNTPSAVQISVTNLSLWVTTFLAPFRINLGNSFKTIKKLKHKKLMPILMYKVYTLSYNGARFCNKLGLHISKTTDKLEVFLH
jgi:hypothetical protein